MLPRLLFEPLAPAKAVVAQPPAEVEVPLLVEALSPQVAETVTLPMAEPMAPPMAQVV